MEPRLIDAISDYLYTHVEHHGHGRTAEAFGVSRHTLWRFLDRGQAGRALPHAVTAQIGTTIEALLAATRALEISTRPAELSQSHQQVPPHLRDVLLLLCEAPFTSVGELSRLSQIPASTLRGQLAGLRARGLSNARPHRLAELGGRPHQRFFPTSAGIIAAGEATTQLRHVLRKYPVSRQWFRLLGERLDAVAVLYQVAAMVAEADPQQEPLRIDHYRQGPYDALVTLSGGRSLGLVRQGPMLTAANLRYRLRTIERLDARDRPQVTLVLTDSDQDTRRTLRALADPLTHRSTAVATLGELLAGGAEAEVWQPGGYGFDSTPVMAPDISLAQVVVWVGRRARASGSSVGDPPKPDPDGLYRSDVRATLPASGERFDNTLATLLTGAEKQVLDLLAAWPFTTTEQLAGLMGGIGRRRANQVLSPLQQRALVRRDGEAYVLTDEGLTYLARRDRAAVGPTLDRWTPQLTDAGVYIGTALRAISSQREHQRGITEFAARLTAEAARSPDHELVGLLPTQRSQISYDYDGDVHVLHPDASFQLCYLGDWDWCLLEYERRATTPRRLRARLRSYRDYFASGYAARDHGGQPPLVLFVFESEQVEEDFLSAASRLPGVPLASATTAMLGRHGALGPAWSMPGPHAPERRPLHFLRELHFVQSPRAEHFQ